jgi:hypothetical protein
MRPPLILRAARGQTPFLKSLLLVSCFTHHVKDREPKHPIKGERLGGTPRGRTGTELAPAKKARPRSYKQIRKTPNPRRGCKPFSRLRMQRYDFFINFQMLRPFFLEELETISLSDYYSK